MTKQPKYSILIPTRNRAHLMRTALACAVNQQFDDYEIVVSDNDSSDDTRAAVETFSNPRIRYVRTPRTLSMPDSWEFALSQAAGEWITVLTDDSAISSRLLAEVDKVLNSMKTHVVSWSHLNLYFHESWPNASERNTLVYHPYQGTARVLPSQELIEKWYNFVPDHTAPVSLNSFCHRPLIDKIRKSAGRFFFPICPDISSCVAMMANTEHYVYLEWPLAVNGIGKESIGMSQAIARGKAAREFEDEFEGSMFHEAPLHLPLVANYIIESLLRVKKAFPVRLQSQQINRGLYYHHCDLSLRHLESQGVDVRAWREELFHALSSEPFSVKVKVRLAMLTGGMNPRRTAAELRRRVRGFLNRSKTFVAIESRMRRRPEYGGTVRGSDAGFSNIFEAMQHLDRIAFSSGRS